MSKTLGLIFVFAVMIMSFVSATVMNVDPAWSNMPTTGEKDVNVCITSNVQGVVKPVVGMPLVINNEATDLCLDANHNSYCDPSDVYGVSGNFFITIKQSPTDANGCGVVTLHTVNAQDSDYAYRISGLDAGVVAIQENASFYIPEFGIIGALLFLGLAGLFVAWKRH
jgi:hypothetical protein